MSDLDPVHPIAELPDDERKVAQQPRLTVADALQLPALCGGREIAALWGISASQFHKRNKQGAYDRFKVTPAVGPRCFSGVLIAKYLSGEPLYIPSFGRKTLSARHG